MSRYISFMTLLAVIVLLAILFFRVMAGFFIPLFLAALLVVIFRPLHARLVERCGGRQRIAALLTTIAILLVVLVPFSILCLLAAFEGQQLVRGLNKATLMKTVADTRKKLNLEIPPLAEELKAVEIRLENMSQLEQLEDISYLGGGQLSNTRVYNDDLQKKLSDQLNSSQALADAWDGYTSSFEQLQGMQEQIANPPEADASDEEQIETDSPAVRFFDFQHQLNQTIDRFEDFKVRLLGGSRFWIWLTELANPTPEVLEQYGSTAIEYLRKLLLNIGTSTTSYVGKLLLGLIVMVISLYFFLLDGPKMLDSLKQLSPIDDQYEQELYEEFGRVSRAVVVATLLAALVQGLLGGIGYYFAGLQSVFLLTLLTGVLALVPFVGAAAVWIPCSLWLYFVDNNLTAAIGLAVYGMLVISMSDNLIKPLVLHGQSNLHPLLALLSVLGGVAALGPIGILIGPMIVAFLQTMLKILQREMIKFDAQSTVAAAD